MAIRFSPLEHPSLLLLELPHFGTSGKEAADYTVEEGVVGTHFVWEASPKGWANARFALLVKSTSCFVHQSLIPAEQLLHALHGRADSKRENAPAETKPNAAAAALGVEDGWMWEVLDRMRLRIYRWRET